MFRFCFMGMLGAVIFASNHGRGASLSADSRRLSQATHNSTGMPLPVGSDFVPDTLSRADDDEEDEPGEHPVQESTGTVKQNTSSLGSPSHASQGTVEKAVSGQGALLKNTGQALDVAAIASTATRNRVVTQPPKPRGSLPDHSPFPFSSTDSTNPANRNVVRDKNKSTGPTSEEEKLGLTTRKLVKWLRNRLRKRLEEVAGLEEKCEVETKVLTSLKETIEAEALERQAEIKMKLETQDELKDLRRQFAEPDRDVRDIRAENSKLVDQLSHLKRMYNDLSVSRKDMENRLVSAGFTYWLDKRGKEYMPATAVGVLSKSARLLDPFSMGLEEVVKLDELFSSGVEGMMPISKRSLVSKIVRDFALLLPVIPVIMLCWRLRHISRRLSVLHLVMYISAIFAIESGILFVLSLCIGSEVIKELQKSYELLVVTGAFVNVLLFTVMIILQMVVMVLRKSKAELMQTLLCLAVGYHFFRTLFQPVVVSQLPTATTPAHSMYAISFILITLEKKAILKVGTRFDKQLNSCLLAIERWFCETLQAMKDLFEEALPDKKDDDTISVEAVSLSSYNEVLKEVEPLERPTPVRKEADIEEVTKALNASRGYVRWTAGRKGQNSSQGRSGFRGMRWHQTNPQPTFLQSGSEKAGGQEGKS